MYGPSEAIEQFFVDVLGLDVATATHEADQLSRSLDDDTLERLEGFFEFARMRGFGAMWVDRQSGLDTGREGRRGRRPDDDSSEFF